MNSLAEAFSLWLTAPAVFLSIAVLYYWREQAITALKKPNKDAVDWLLLGIFISFVGSILDNTYWGIAWGADYIGHPTRDFWFQNGVWPNIPFRQVALLLAAYCHLRGAFKQMAKKDRHTLRAMVKWSSLFGLAVVLALTFYRA